jgi:myo-inositol-1(or 4)-monophosphatase
VDPLDGTTNFLHGIPHWAISIGLEKRLADGGSELAAAVVYSPVNNEMFWAEKGVGAYLNDKRLRVSARRELKDAVFATGIPFAAASGSSRLAFARTMSVLMPQVAGRYDGYWEVGIKPWDIAAGMLIVREAGGYATDSDGKDLVADTIVAANPHLHAKLLEVVADGLAASKA